MTRSKVGRTPKSGAFSPSRIGELRRKHYQRLLWRVRYATGATDLKTRLLLRQLAGYHARRELAEAWLAEHRDPYLFAKLDEWDAAEARLIEKLPDDAPKKPRLGLASRSGQHRP